MKGHNMLSFLTLCAGCISALVVPAARASDVPERIESVYFDQGAVGKLFLYPGRSTLIDFPCEVTKASSGPAGDLVVTVGSTDKSELDVWLKSGTSQPTNLTVRCGKDVFVFDVIPNRTTHQEYLEIAGSYGGPGYKTQQNASLPDPYAKKKLIATSTGKPASSGSLVGRVRAKRSQKVEASHETN